MKIKICGVTRLEDALVCVNNGVDFIGLNFHSLSPRYLSLDAAQNLVEGLGSERSKVKFVGVFVNTSPQEINSIAMQVGLNAAQLHGDEPSETLCRLYEMGIPSFKGFRGPPSIERFTEFTTPPQDPTFPNALIDAYQPGLFGGTGEVMKSDQVGGFIKIRATAPQQRIMLAGGLNPNNVTQMIQITNPWGVDSASGVEVRPGIKDSQKIIEFCRAARSREE